MKIDRIGAFFAIVLVLLAIAAIVLIVYRLDLSMLYTIVLVLVVGLVLSLCVAASALPIRAAREHKGPHEREIIREKHTIDGRVAEAPKIHLLNNQQQPGALGMFPELLRAAYLAGHRSITDGGGPEIVEADVRDVTAEWEGEIRD